MVKNTLIGIGITFLCLILILFSAVKALFFALIVSSFGLILSAAGVLSLKINFIRKKFMPNLR